MALPNETSGWGENPEEITGQYEFYPIIESTGLKTTFTWKPTHYFQFTSGLFLGYSVGSVYKSNGGDRYLWGGGNRWNVSMAIAFVSEDNDKNFNYENIWLKDNAHLNSDNHGNLFVKKILEELSKYLQ